MGSAFGGAGQGGAGDWADGGRTLRAFAGARLFRRGARNLNALTCGFAEPMLSWGAHLGTPNVNVADTFGLETQAVVDFSVGLGGVATPQVSEVGLSPRTGPGSGSTAAKCAAIRAQEIKQRLTLDAGGPKNSSCVWLSGGRVRRSLPWALAR